MRTGSDESGGRRGDKNPFTVGLHALKSSRDVVFSAPDRLRSSRAACAGSRTVTSRCACVNVVCGTTGDRVFGKMDYSVPPSYCYFYWLGNKSFEFSQRFYLRKYQVQGWVWKKRRKIPINLTELLCSQTSFSYGKNRLNFKNPVLMTDNFSWGDHCYQSLILIFKLEKQQRQKKSFYT